MKISVCGKGGSGKSSIVTLLANAARDRGLEVLVVDSDESNSGLYRMLGFVRAPVPLMELLGGKKSLKQKMSQPQVLAQAKIWLRDIPSEYMLEQDGIQLDRSDDGEGTAMLEVVHSIAPGAELGFATYKTKVAENIKALAQENPAWKKCDIIVDDYEDFAESPFQDEEVSQAINYVTGKGILYIGGRKVSTRVSYRNILGITLNC